MADARSFMTGAMEWWRQHPFAGVLTRFVAYFVVFEVLVILAYTRTPLGMSLSLLTARWAAALIGATGVPATLSGITIEIPNRVLGIGWDCTAIYIVAMFAALLLAYPIKWSMRLLGVLIGTIVILIANLLRLVLVAHISVWAPSIFGFAHDVLFQVGMVLVAAAMWVAWLSFARRHVA